MEDYFDFDRLKLSDGLQTMMMSEFLDTIAKPGLLNKPLPNNDIELIRAPLYEYLEQACYVKQWSPGMTYLGFNIPPDNAQCQSTSSTASATSWAQCIGDFNYTNPNRINEFSLGKRVLVPYDAEFHQQRAIYFPGHEKNRLLTNFYSYLFFGTKAQDQIAKRFMRDRLRYHDEIFCVGSNLVEVSCCRCRPMSKNTTRNAQCPSHNAHQNMLRFTFGEVTSNKNTLGCLRNKLWS